MGDLEVASKAIPSTDIFKKVSGKSSNSWPISNEMAITGMLTSEVAPRVPVKTFPSLTNKIPAAPCAAAKEVLLSKVQFPLLFGIEYD